MSNVDAQHPAYKLMKNEWATVKAMASGSRAVKAMAGDLLPPPGDTLITDARYVPYLDRAIYTNYTGRTQVGLTGSAMRKPTVFELPSELEYLIDDSNGAGLSLEQSIKSTLSSLFETGRELLLVDYPEASEDLKTKEDEARLNPEASIMRYGALDAINWKFDGETLILAVLAETYNASDDEFEHDIKIQYRVLRLDDAGYSQQIEREGVPVTEVNYIVGADGRKFDFIPLFCIGSETNDFGIDDIPLADIAAVNRGHYINSADYEESLHIMGQSMIHIDAGDMDDEQWKAANPNGVKVGSRAGIRTNGGSLAFVQAEERSGYNTAREEKKTEMVNLGAKLVEQRGQAQTATASKIDASGESSVLSDMVTNVEDGYRTAISWCAKFMTTSEPVFTLDMNRDFFPAEVSPQLLIAGLQYFNSGIIGKPDLQELARTAELTDRSDEDINDSVDQDAPLLLAQSTATKPAATE